MTSPRRRLVVEIALVACATITLPRSAARRG